MTASRSIAPLAVGTRVHFAGHLAAPCDGSPLPVRGSRGLIASVRQPGQAGYDYWVRWDAGYVTACDHQELLAWKIDRGFFSKAEAVEFARRLAGSGRYAKVMACPGWTTATGQGRDWEVWVGDHATSQQTPCSSLCHEKDQV